QPETPAQKPNAAESAPPPTTLKSRQFWLGALAAACLLVPAGVIGVVLASGSEDPAASGGALTSAVKTPTPDAQDLEQASEVRDKGQVKELTDLMRTYATELDPVVKGIDTTLPPGEDGKVGKLASASDVEAWVKATTTASAFFDETVSGE